MSEPLTPYRDDSSKSNVSQRTPRGKQRQRYQHTLGSIIWMALLRLVITIFVAWYLHDYIPDYSEWWMLTVLGIYGVAIYPAQIQYEYFKETNKRLMESTLCSSCRYFRPENLHCTKLDEHVSEHHLPCEGIEWEPKSLEIEEG